MSDNSGLLFNDGAIYRKHSRAIAASMTGSGKVRSISGQREMETARRKARSPEPRTQLRRRTFTHPGSASAPEARQDRKAAPHHSR